MLLEPQKPHPELAVPCIPPGQWRRSGLVRPGHIPAPSLGHQKPGAQNSCLDLQVFCLYGKLNGCAVDMAAWSSNNSARGLRMFKTFLSGHNHVATQKKTQWESRALWRGLDNEEQKSLGPEHSLRFANLKKKINGKGQ